MKNITVVLGTARDGCQSDRVAKALVGKLAAAGNEATLVDVKEHVQVAATIPPWGEKGADAVPTVWKETVAKTDTFIFVLPEYNHGYPGEWKLLMDSLYKEYAGKNAYVVTVSGGSLAGVRVMEHVLPILDNFGFVIGTKRLHIGNVADVVSEAGDVTDDGLAKRMKEFVDAVGKSA